ERGQLVAQERVAHLVGGGEVGHDARELEPVGVVDRRDGTPGLVDVAGAQAAHAGVELDVHAQPPAGERRDEALVPGGDVGRGGDAKSRAHAASGATYASGSAPVTQAGQPYRTASG